MEEKGATEQIHHQERAAEAQAEAGEKPNIQDQVNLDDGGGEKPSEIREEETKQDEKIVVMVGEIKQSAAGTKQEMPETKDKFTSGTKQVEAEKAGKSRTDSTKKPKQVQRQIPKPKTTVPQPFSLATDKRPSRERWASMDLSTGTEKRMIRERQASMDSKDLQGKLAKSASFNYKKQSSPCAKETSNPKRNTSTVTSSRPKVASTEPVDNRIENMVKTKDKVQVKEVESRYLQSNSRKQQTNEADKSKLQKSSTFKATPLPSFYRRKDPPSKPEMPVHRSKPPSLGRQRSKSATSTTTATTNVEDKNTEDEGKSRSVSRKISNTAKETINKLIKGTRKALTTAKGNSK